MTAFPIFPIQPFTMIVMLEATPKFQPAPQMKFLFSNLIPAFSPLVIIFFFISVNSVIEAVDPYYETCTVPKSCGNQSITFPFFIQGQQEPYCGYPGFNLSCDHNGRSLLKISGQNYVVRQIFYQNQSIDVSNAAFWDPNHKECVPPVRNLSLPPDFKVAENQSRVFLLYNCQSLDETLMKYSIGCSAGNDTNSVLAFYENDRDRLANASEKCGTRDVVVAKTVGYGGMVTREVLSRGFMLNWVASDCSYCESTKGRCGFNFETYHFQCYCPDMPHAARCDMPGNVRVSRAAILAIIAATVAAIAIVAVVILCRLSKKSSNAFIFSWKKHSQTDRNIEAFLRNYGPLQVRRYSYSDIKKMTNSFSEKIGQGGFGDVYKGKLDDGYLLAVKVLNQSKGEDGQEFINEVATISRTSHVNVVTLMGFCFDGPKRALIYEFMPNGSLEKFIFDEDIATENSHRLDWETHYQISLGISRGLEYLHRGCNTRILHFDIKPHNILLDAEFVPKISDFGLAKICTRKESLVSMLGPRGTIGYIAPEVFNRNFGGVSHKSDVYSYGMMILEMVGGRKNINIRVDDTSEIYFPQWIYRRLKLDEELGLKRVTNEEDRVKVKKMIIVSLWCIQTDPSNRPAMSGVIEMLEGSLDSLEIPPKPFFSSPSRSPPPESSGTFVSSQI